jgi:hypothetical protein
LVVTQGYGYFTAEGAENASFDKAQDARFKKSARGELVEPLRKFLGQSIGCFGLFSRQDAKNAK